MDPEAFTHSLYFGFLLTQHNDIFLLITASISTFVASRSGLPAETALQFNKQPEGAAVHRINYTNCFLCVSVLISIPPKQLTHYKNDLGPENKQYLLISSPDSKDSMIMIITMSLFTNISVMTSSIPQANALTDKSFLICRTIQTSLKRQYAKKQTSLLVLSSFEFPKLT